MTSYTDLELWALVSAVYYDRNEIVTYPTGKTQGRAREAVTGLQAEILHTESADEIEDIGPDEVFVTSRDICEITNYTELGTVRRRLDDLVDEGLLEHHSDMADNPQNEHRQYLPAELGYEDVVKALHERDGRSIPDSLQPETRTHVTPSDFVHAGETVFELESDRTIQLDVGEPADGQSIQGAIGEQLDTHNLTADLNNFVYTLRDRAGLT